MIVDFRSCLVVRSQHHDVTYIFCLRFLFCFFKYKPFLLKMISLSRFECCDIVVDNARSYPISSPHPPTIESSMPPLRKYTTSRNDQRMKIKSKRQTSGTTFPKQSITIPLKFFHNDDITSHHKNIDMAPKAPIRKQSIHKSATMTIVRSSPTTYPKYDGKCHILPLNYTSRMAAIA
jgi:hypothetical protein